MHSQRPSTGDSEFNFWGARKSMHVKNFSDHISGGDKEFGAQAHLDQDGFEVYSSPSWEANTLKNINYESFPLLPQNYDSATQPISESRRKLMEMIHNMPESCYELSLKDIVDEQHGQQEEVADEIVIKDRSFHSDTAAQTKKQDKKKFKIGQLSRSRSMENETFLIKMFFPTSLGSNKKAKPVNHSKVSTSSSKQSENHQKIDGRVTGFVISRLNKIIFRKSISTSTSTSHSNSSTNRYLLDFAQNLVYDFTWLVIHKDKTR